MRYRDDYSAAGVPMLPVVRGPRVVGVQIALYSWALVASSLLLIVSQPMGVIYTVIAILSGGWFLFTATKLHIESKSGEPKHPMHLFHGSITYLTVLFVAIAIDPLLFISL
jgi:protoheme IX farnesyltransferase